MIVKPNQKIQVASNNDAPSEVIISGTIGDWGLQGKDLRNALDSVPKGKKINLRVNSEGGSVQDGLEMYHAIKERSADTTAYIHGYALSSASVFPLAASKVVSPKGSIWMIHCAACYSYGNEADKTKDAEMLKVHDDEMATIYGAKTGKSKKEILDAMKAESWFGSEDAVEFGLADESPDPGDDEPILSLLDTTKFQHVPGPLLMAISMQAAKQKANLTAGQTQNTMNKKKIIAILKKHGVEASEDWSWERLEEALEKIENKTATTQPANVPATTQPANVPATTQPANVVTIEQMNALNARLDAERLTRISGEVRSRAENKIPNDKIDWWIKQALANETDTFAQLDALPERSVGGARIGNLVTLTAESPVEAIRKANPGKTSEAVAKRYAAVGADWVELWADAQERDRRAGNFDRPNVRMENSYSATLVTNFLIDGAVTKLQNRWPALKTFARDFSTDRYKPRATGQLKFVDNTDGVVQTNPTNWESGDSTVDPCTIAVNQYSRSFHVTNDQLNSGLRMENLLEINMSVFADKVIQSVTGSITAANFNVLAPIVVAPGNFSWGNMQTAWGELQKSTVHNALLRGDYLAKIINVPTQFQKTGVAAGAAWAEFGWDNIALNTNWSGADANVTGFACNPQAIGVISGLPLTPPNIPGATLQESTVLLPDIGITIANYMWFSLASRTLWYSFDLMLGSNLLDSSAGLLIRSA